MRQCDRLETFEQLKLLADERRMKILRLLMASPASLTQLARNLGQSPAWVRHHIQRLQSARLIELVKVSVTHGITEKFYRACAAAFLLQQLILPDSPAHTIVILSGSHDLALEILSREISRTMIVIALPIGSLDGLVNLRQGLCHISGAHLLDESGEYNTPFVRHLFPDRHMEMVTLAHRTQGLMVAPGNPKQVRSLLDLVRPEISFMNRNPGSGTRLWLDRALQGAGLSQAKINGHERCVHTHSQAALAVQSGIADAALGIQAAAHQIGLGFIPLFEERFDLVIPREQLPPVAPLLETMQTAGFRNRLRTLTGYDTTHTGEQIVV